MIERVGIVGVGHLASFLVEGLRREDERLAILVSPRNAARSADLAARFAAEVASDNQAVADAAELVVLSTRPADAVDAARSIAFRAEQTVISVVAGLEHAALRPAVAPAILVRAMPISCAAIGASPTVIYPDHPGARELFGRVGDVHVLTEESQFAVATSVAAFYGWLFALVDQTAAWAARQGLAPELARSLVLETVRGTANMGLARPHQELAAMLESLATPGGLTEQGLRVLERHGGTSAWEKALDAVLRRLNDD